MARRVAHELKNPLTPIRLAATRVARHSDPDLNEAGQVILEELGRLDDLARSFSQLGRPPEGPPSEVDLLELLRSLARAHSSERIRVEVEHLGGPTTIQGHLGALDGVFRNLLTNALEAMEGAGMAGEIRLTLQERPDETSVVVTVDDEGPGLPEELRQDLWVPEFTTKRRGTGLGLALVRRTVELHGGSATAEDRPGGGARFTVQLPTEPAGGSSGERQPGKG
jgi:signal transduction histidine kinase